jgi:hypothetical protein
MASASALAWGIVFAAGCSAAVARGPTPVRMVAGALAVELVAVLALQPLENHFKLSPTSAIGDAAVWVVCLVAAKRTGARWAIGAAGLQGAAIACHVAKVFDPSIRSWGYLTLQSFWSFCVLACVLAGSFSTGKTVDAG